MAQRPIHSQAAYASDMPRVLLNIQHYGNAWTVHFLRDDCPTRVGP
jgi:hypothetical protein